MEYLVGYGISRLLVRLEVEVLKRQKEEHRLGRSMMFSSAALSSAKPSAQ